MGRRSGTENVIGIAGFGAAAEAAVRDLDAGVWTRVEKLRNILESAIEAGSKETIFVGKGATRLPNTTCFATPGWKGETQVMQMDLSGFAISAGSACSSGKVRASVVLTAMGPPLLVIYLAADVGSIGGGYLFKLFRNRGWNVNRSRKAAMACCAGLALPVIGILHVQSLWPAVALIALATAAHQGFSANLFTLVSDTTPRPAVASVVGMGGLAGAVAGMLIAPVVGYWLDLSGGVYAPMFIIGACAYFIALAVIHGIVPVLRDPQGGVA